jgi:hypothetical protein
MFWLELETYRFRTEFVLVQYTGTLKKQENLFLGPIGRNKDFINLN